MSLRPERVDFDETWMRIRETVRAVINLERVIRSDWNERFTDVYKLCVAFPEPLGDKLYQETKAFLDNHVKNLYKIVSNSPSETLLESYHQKWLIYREGNIYLDRLYQYLNIQHIKKHKFSEADISFGCVESQEQLLEIGELGLHLWKINMIEPLKESLVRLVLEAIEKDRMGIMVPEATVHGVIMSFVYVEEYKKKGSLDLYQRLFEQPFLQATAEYYKREAERLLETCNCSQYMEKVLQKLDAENMRSRKYLDPSSYSRVLAACEQKMVGEYLNFLHSECKVMVRDERRRDLQNMYKLLKSVDRGLDKLVADLQEQITKVGLEAIECLSGDSQPIQFVESILAVHRKYWNLIKEVFNGDQIFISCLDKACATVINCRGKNKGPSRSPELLARYCDGLLKKSGSGKGASESEVEDKLAASITVFKYIDDKDVFQKFYSKMLAKRLIHSQSLSMEAEESMINKLKQACGYEFTSKLHRMFTDIKVSDDLNNAFNVYLKQENILLGVNFNIYVLQAGAWPLGQSAISPFAIPLVLEKSVQHFENFYNSKFNGRKLTWLHHLCTAEIKFGFTKKPYIVSCGSFHLAILLCFEGSDSLAYRELQEITKLTEEQLTKHLQSLCDAKILQVSHSPSCQQSKDTAGKSESELPIVEMEDISSSHNKEAGDSSETQTDVNPYAASTSVSSPSSLQSSNSAAQASFFDDKNLVNAMFTLNLNYASKRTKFKITAVPQREVQHQQQDVEQTHASVEEDRKLYLQAAIVRIMKARKVIKHNALIQEVINQAKNRFTPSVAMIKKCIEALMEKQYLERTSASADEYSYVA